MPLTAARPMCRASSAAFWGNAMTESNASARASASSVVVSHRQGQQEIPSARRPAVGSPGCALRNDNF